MVDQTRSLSCPLKCLGLITKSLTFCLSIKGFWLKVLIRAAVTRWMTRFDAIICRPWPYALLCVHRTTKFDTILATWLSIKIPWLPDSKEKCSDLSACSTSSFTTGLLKSATLELEWFLAKSSRSFSSFQDRLKFTCKSLAISTKPNSPTCTISSIWSLTWLKYVHTT